MVACSSVSQNIDHIRFDYDAAGNQIRRYVIDLNPGKVSQQTSNSALSESDIYNDVKYRPNPVSEELYITWINKGDNYVNTIYVYSSTGQLISHDTVGYPINEFNLTFSNCPAGLYTVTLCYTSGDKKTLKIIKR